MKKTLLFLSVIFTLMFIGCSKDKPESFLLYQNTLPTDLTFTANGKTTTISAGTSASFTGDLGQPFPYTATTSGKTSSGTQVGIAITFTNTDYFPSSAGATSSNSFVLNSNDFFLYITNNSNTPINEVVVNAGTTDSTIDNITIPANGNEYPIGYYNAFSNTVIDLYYTGGYYSNSASLTYLTDANGNTYYDFIVP